MTALRLRGLLALVTPFLFVFGCYVTPPAHGDEKSFDQNATVNCRDADIRDTLERTKRATWAVAFPIRGKELFYWPVGTGFFVSSDGWFVTAKHVLMNRNGTKIRDDVKKINLKKEHGSLGGDFTPRLISLSLKYVDPKIDFALLKLNFRYNMQNRWLKTKTIPYVEVSSRTLVEGEPVYAFGYPLARWAENPPGAWERLKKRKKEKESSLPEEIPPELKRQGIVGIVSEASIISRGIGLCPRITSLIVSSTIANSNFNPKYYPDYYVLDKPFNAGNSGGPVIANETGKVYALCKGFQPMGIRQKELERYLEEYYDKVTEEKNFEAPEQIQIMMPSQYGIAVSLANPEILKTLREFGVPISDN